MIKKKIQDGILAILVGSSTARFPFSISLHNLVSSSSSSSSLPCLYYSAVANPLFFPTIELHCSFNVRGSPGRRMSLKGSRNPSGTQTFLFRGCTPSNTVYIIQKPFSLFISGLNPDLFSATGHRDQHFRLNQALLRAILTLLFKWK